MRFLVLILVFGLIAGLALAQEHFKRPAPYAAGKIYVLPAARGGSRSPSADGLRQHAPRIIRLGDAPGERDVIYFWDHLRWGQARHDPKIKERAGPLTMVIDLYRRGRPDETPDTLYGTSRFLYSAKGNYLELKPPVSTHLGSFLRK